MPKTKSVYIDWSPSHIGFILVVDQKLEATYCIKTSFKTLSSLETIVNFQKDMALRFVELLSLSKNDNVHFVFEGSSFFSRSGIITQYNQAFGVFLAELAHHVPNFTFDNSLAPLTVKKTFTGSGKADKLRILEAFKEKVSELENMLNIETFYHWHSTDNVENKIKCESLNRLTDVLTNKKNGCFDKDYDCVDAFAVFYTYAKLKNNP
jgi:Holliday junction resolvasome RuvABC endonuclease subunit